MDKEIRNVQLSYLNINDYSELKQVMISSYHALDNAYWSSEKIAKLIEIFPEGQVVIKVDDEIAGCALSIIVSSSELDDYHTYTDITSNYTFDTHCDDGDTLYGIDVFVKPDFRGLRLGRRLYDYRKELCEKLNLKGILFGGRIPNFHKYSDKITAKQYIAGVRTKEIHDPVLNFQLSNDFHPIRLLKNYLKGDVESEEYAVLLRWDNVFYEKPRKKAAIQKKIIRTGLVQWQMRPYKTIEELLQQAEYFVDALSGYKSDFALFPEFFNAPLMAAYNHLSEADAIRELAKYTERVTQAMSQLAISYNINIITGSMPEMVDNMLYNVGYLCKRDGGIERFEKLHVTPDEKKVWALQGGSGIRTFDTDCGKVGILICYDIEFPELSRLLADDGMEILFVPFLTDTQNGYSRVRNCAQARAIENECYVVIAGSVGNLPNVHNMDIQYAQSMVFTPCDFQFPTNGVKAEATPNTEMILIADLDLDLLRDIHSYGSVTNLNDRRKDIYSLSKTTN
ncbi:bifunctional GNAT family N-acetyltransferase/carbon-nitrogen hydrolase family protein [Carboxylicivirga sp. A043]|uniref:carbon-nitrogen hydrolase family protein n=1 Tax=Carboxylicivirga litoralis TaxID=2816963 RepID=UPI0021CB3FD1|nr:bifunctional GNAT family N-acetyltransferase/carbon-nitrogen hydrolase family protein [Carboxylicivirga sp. A043]MCU4155502.1 bifunctional GNAT family N-acetyltransferase/carbon-nitrogen hydrolase family protein [Carboxylicivirga sp. A043]